ncbi:MAG: hypothetical protein HOH58_10760 [Opitutaceae bacterium]|nr:hypothetical protein [Opitutaceae bacterium]
MPQTTQPFTVRSWNEFQQHWDGIHNFRMAEACAPFDFEVPPLKHVICEMREDELTRITTGSRGKRIDLEDFSAEFRAQPIQEAMAGPFALAHFKLSRFDAPGKFLHGFEKKILDPWRAALREAGFTFERCYPIIFISGKNCATNYHMDLSHVVAWQIYGKKRFCGLQDPRRWAPHRLRMNCRGPEVIKPDALREADTLCYEMGPGAVAWNAMLTPHWVEAGDEVAMSINFSHGGLRYQGQLCPHEQEHMDYQAAHPDIAEKSPDGDY